MSAVISTRETRGLQIAQAKESQVSRIDENFYTVKSQSGNGEYAVCKVNGEWTCQCPDHTHRHVACKHIHAVTFSLSVRAEVAVNRVIPELNVNACQYCGASEIVRDGVRHNKQGDLQVYVCKKCGKHTTLNLGFKGMRATPQIITSAMQLYFTGESYRNVQKFLKLQGVEISHVAIMKWIKKYVELMDAYVKKIVPNVSDKWRADEMYIKVAGNMKYLYAMLDDETRFWIAQEVADSKFKHDSREIFYQARWLMKKQPKIFITDGLPTYKTNAERIFPEAKHIRHITLKGQPHNNKMERMNGEVRDREKTMRGLKKMDTPVLKGYQIYHNYVRPHESLGGKTPAEACGIIVEGQNKWRTLIENATKNVQK